MKISILGGGGFLGRKIAARLAAEGTLWQMAPKSLNAAVTLGKPPEVTVDEHKLGVLPDTIDAPPFSVSIYAFPVQ